VLAAQRSIDAGHSTLNDSATKAGGVFKQQFTNIMPLAAAAAGAAVIKFGADSINAFKESEAAMAQTNAVIKSTGGVANVTADDVLNLAASLRDVSGADDEAIQASENLLLTFTNIRNEAGAGNDVFDQTTAAVLDMATSMNNGAIPSMEDLNSKTILVGKAMNDPIKGLTALTRVGVGFKDGQREQIEAMVAAGDTMGAQKIILAELSKEFGGAAKAAGDTFAGAQAKAAQSIEDVQEKFGAILLPVLTEVSAAFADMLTSIEPLIEIIGTVLAAAISSTADALEDMVGPLQTILDLIPQLGTATEDSSGSLFDYTKAVINIGNPITTVTGLGQKWHDIQNILTNDFTHGTEAIERQVPLMDVLASGIHGAVDAWTDGTQAVNRNEDAVRHLTDAMRDQRLATLALTDSYLGILDSADAVAEAQAELNRLERNGKTDMKVYEEAVREAITAQAGLESAVLSYGKELADSGETNKEVRQKVKELAGEFGIQKGVVSELLDEVKSYIGELTKLDKKETKHKVVVEYEYVGFDPSKPGMDLHRATG